jgi:hypothetical protein
MMTETIAPAETRAAESPRIPRPHTDAAALRAIEEATAHVRERALKQHLDILNGQDRVLAILDNFASKDMPGRQAHIQDCVDQILAKVDPKPAAAGG